MPRVPAGYLNERRRQILVAACHVLSKRGIQAATMGEVASEAGISPGLIYRYFPSKEDLVLCAMSESTQDLDARWNEAPVNHPDPLGEFLELSAHTWAMCNDPGEQQHTVLHIEQLLSAVRDGDPVALREARENLDGIVDKIQARLDAAKRAGQVGSHIDTLALARVAVDFYWGTRLRKMLTPDLDIMPAVNVFTAMMGCVYERPDTASS